jgi:hypothetical protein
MQPAAGSYGFNARPQPEMVGVAEDNPGVEFAFELFKANAFDGAGGAHRHEHGSLNWTTSGV